MNAPIVYEAPRFGRTGPGYSTGLRCEFVTDAIAYGLDAPDHIAQGSTSGYLQTGDNRPPQHFVSFTTDRREW